MAIRLPRNDDDMNANLCSPIAVIARKQSASAAAVAIRSPEYDNGNRPCRHQRLPLGGEAVTEGD